MIRWLRALGALLDDKGSVLSLHGGSQPSVAPVPGIQHLTCEYYIHVYIDIHAGETPVLGLLCYD